MTETHTVTCDSPICKADLTDRGDRSPYRLVLKHESIPPARDPQGGVVRTAVATPLPEFYGVKHFCSTTCLREWLNRPPLS